MYLYRILGLNKDATAEQIERKYHDLEIKYRMDPNLGSDFEKTRMLHDINCAYKVLSNRRRRQIYDRLGGDVLSIFQAQRDDRDGAAIERWLHCIIKPCPMRLNRFHKKSQNRQRDDRRFRMEKDDAIEV
ncbi:unnamed protein product [Heligmosomoides polygyrus]|uniref:J domain-containing protein n=1 Tax=Heligmosomoides polygyrus TaxID=6339 RepID=A0A183GND9_HELPZ|nr:unnamed protein product [Heligmosomoides polygyrus]